MPSLSDISKNGWIRDNQHYVSTGNEFLNSGWKKESWTLTARKRGKSKDHNAWGFLQSIAHDLPARISEERDNGLLLFAEMEYEHNTSDPLIHLTGTSANDFTLSTGNLVGTIKQGHHALRVSSRFGDNFLKFIIADADGFLEIKESGGEGHGDIDWLIVYMWLIKLKRAYRLGLPKSYVGRRETLPRVRGRIDPLHYALNRDRASYKCEYREHSYCNPATILISETLRTLKGNSFLSEAHSIANVFHNAAEGKRLPLRKLLETPHFSNPFYSDYNDLIDLSQRILSNSFSDFGADTETSAFLFDVSMLFEYFVRKRLKRHGAKFEPKSKSTWNIPAGRPNGRRFKLYPDLFFSIGEKAFVFDVKYKAYDFQNGVSREDLFQIHTYLGQAKNEYHVAGCGFIFPIRESKWNVMRQERKLVKSETIMHAKSPTPFHVSFVPIPDDIEKVDSNGRSFHERFENSIKKWLNGLETVLLRSATVSSLNFTDQTNSSY